MYLTRLLFATSMLFSGVLYADIPKIPSVGYVEVNGEFVDVSFYLTQDEVDSLQTNFDDLSELYPSDRTSKLSRFFDYALDINIIFDNWDDAKLEEIRAGNLEQDINELWKSRVYDNGVVVREDVTWQFNQAGLNPGTEIFVRDETTGSKYSALVMRAHNLEALKWYTIRFEFTELIPDNTDVTINVTAMRDEQGLYLSIPALEDTQWADPLALGSELVSAMHGESVGHAVEIALLTMENYGVIQEGIYTQAFLTIFGQNAGVWQITDNFKALAVSIGKGLYNATYGLAVGMAATLNAAEHTPYGDAKTFNAINVSNGSGLMCWSDFYPNGSPDACQSPVISSNPPPADAGANAGEAIVLNGSSGNQNQDTSGSGDTNLSIQQFRIKEDGGSYQRELNLSLETCESTYIEGELELRNKSSSSADNIVIDYRVEDQDKNFDTDDPKIDDDEEVSIGGDETITKHMGRSRITARCDGTGIDIFKKSGGLAETILAEGGYAKGYYFVEVENEDTGDDDLSSTNSYDEEYGVLNVTITGDPKYADVIVHSLASGTNQQGLPWGLDYTVENGGLAPIEQTFGVAHYRDGEMIGSATIPPLGVGESFTAQVTGTEISPGTKQIQAIYEDPDPFTDFSDQNNHSNFGTLTVNPILYNLKLHSLTGGTTREGDTWTLQFTIDNEGETLPADIALKVMLGSTRLPNIEIQRETLPGYTSKTFQVSGTGPTPGTYTLDVRFEGSSHFTETNVNDNITQSTLTVNHLPQKPTGHVSTYNCSQIKGTASDPNGAGPVSVDIYRDNVKKATLSANTSFTYNLGWQENDSTTHTWKAIARDDHKGGDAGDTTLKQFSMKCNNTMPSGWLEHATRTSVHGWGWDPNRPNNPINIHVYTEWGYRGGGNAPHYRGDLPGNKKHAFNITTDDLCWGITDGWANVKVAFLDALSGHTWSNTLNLPCN